MARNKKPSRKDDMKKARSLLARYKEHQQKLAEEPNSLSKPHWQKEKRNFYAKVLFYFTRSGEDLNDLI
ncbi:MAG TPA: hypothetical protein VKK79_12420 [Candidatus Lokiarchaeia archaeon]|nr:hypothetical protein [Candidatus Lokiarchaeia archaeon]